MVQVGTIRQTILFLSILVSGGNLLIPRVPVLAIIIGLYLLLPAKRHMDRRLIPIILLLLAVLGISFFQPGGIQFESLAVRYANFIAAALLLNIYLHEDAGTLEQDLWPIGKWMSIQALVTLFCIYFATFIFIGIPVQGVQYRTFFLILNYHIINPDAPMRPDGFFYEPGVLQLYLNLYLYLALFIFKNWRHVALALFAVLATRSTTGVVISVLLLSAAFLERFWHGDIRAKIAGATLALVVGLPIGLVAQSNLEDKFVGDARGSSWAREYDLFTGLNIAAENWKVGIGFDYEQYNDAAATLGYTDTLLNTVSMLGEHGNTNGLVFLLYAIGIPLSIPFFFGMFRSEFFRHRFLVGAILFLSLTSEPLSFTPIPLFIMFSGLTWRVHFEGGRRRSAKVSARTNGPEPLPIAGE